MHAEEDPRPADIQDQLQAEQGQRHHRVAETRWLPDEPGRDRHQDVECGPHRTKHGIGRTPRRLGQCFVPIIDLRRRGDRSEPTGTEANDQEHDQANPVAFGSHDVPP